MPPCGCRTGCQHRDHPGQPAQRECRAGIVPNAVPTPGRVVQLERVAELARAVIDMPYVNGGQWLALRRALADLDADSLTVQPAPAQARPT